MGLFPSIWAGQVHQILDHLMEEVRLAGVRCTVEHLLAAAARDDQTGLAQLSQVMRDRGAAHLHHRRDVQHAFLPVA